VLAVRTVLAIACLLLACGDGAVTPRAEPRIKLWHTFDPTGTEALNAVLPGDVEPTLLPFARAQTIVARELATGRDCPDLVRIDATWLPGLARDGLLLPVPERLAARDWLPEASELASFGGVGYGLPQAIDGLALLYRTDAVTGTGVTWPPQTMGELLAAAHRITSTGDDRWGLGVRVDGYWFLPFLRAWGGTVIDPHRGVLGIDSPEAARALERFAELFGAGGIVPPPPPSGSEASDEVRRFRAGSPPIAINGPWVVADLTGGDTRGLGVAPLPLDRHGRPTAPRGAQLLVVPRCAGAAEAAWALANDLTAPALQADWARRFGVVPTTAAGLRDAGAFAQAFYEALRQARPLPQHPLTAELFDDLNPAIAAVVAGDATGAEALAGVGRAWRRLGKRHGLHFPEPADDADAGPE
jgi:arabinogalactan oligomer / maltooligosaccharide transport system substrate-binding protein